MLTININTTKINDYTIKNGNVYLGSLTDLDTVEKDGL